MRLFSILLFFISCYFKTIAQNDIREFPYSPDSLNITESTPIYLSDAEMILFYCSPKNDTIFISKTTNGGSIWSNPKFVIATGITASTPIIYLSSLLTPSNRIIICWSILSVGMFSIYSDDFGSSWTQPNLILGGGAGSTNKRNYNLNLSQISSNKIWLSFNFGNNGGICYYRESTDNGQTWGDNTNATLYTFYNLYTPYIGEVSFIAINEMNIIAFYHSASNGANDIYMRKTSDGGFSWGDHILITGTEMLEKRPRALLAENGVLYLVYQREYLTIKTGLIQNDILYKTSTDNGNNWSEEQRFTKYLGDDNFFNISKDSKKPFISFVTQRFSPIIANKKIAYGIVGETVEYFTPPFVYEMSVFKEDNFGDPLENIINITVQDDDLLKEAYVVLSDSQIIQLYDDGLHFDKVSNDFIYGNKFMLADYPDKNEGYINVNRLTIPVSPNGSLASYRNSFQLELRYTAADLENNIISGLQDFLLSARPLGYYDNVGFLFAGGFLLTGYSNENLWGCGIATASLIENFIPGRVNDSSNPKNQIYAIDFDDLPFGIEWQRWKDAVDIGADFYDGDKDGIYNPIDLNNNGIWDKTEDMPDLIGDRTLWTVFNDGQPGNERTRFAGVDPQGIEIQQTVFASSSQELESILFVRYRIINRGTVAEVLDSVILGLWSDPDIGLNFDNDKIGSDTLLQSSFCYSGPDPDSLGFWNTPPAFYTTLLQGVPVQTINSDTAYIKRGPQIGQTVIPSFVNSKINSFVHYVSSDPLRGDPNDQFELRNYMRGRLKLGEVFDPCVVDPWGGVFGGVDCNSLNPSFWYSGDPVTNTGWMNTTGTDQRIMLSSGPINLIKDEPVEVIYAYVIGRGTDEINSIIVARENVQRAIQEYQSNFSSLAYDPGEPNFVIDNYELFQNYPNPFNPTTTIRYDVLADGIVTIKVYDILGQEVRTLVNEFKPARRYEVQFNSKGLASGVYIYKLQVNDYSKSKKMMILK